MKTGFVRHGFLATRVLGSLLGAFMIVGAVMYNDTVSDIRDRLPPEKLFLHILGYSIVSLPLIVPWRFVRWPALWWPLFSILCFDVAAMLYRGVVDAIWAFRYGESTQQLMFPLLGFVFVSILGMQVFAVLHLRRRSPNHAVELTAARSAVSGSSP